MTVDLSILPKTLCAQMQCSTLYHQSNGQMERAIQTVKRLLRNGADPCMPLLCYRAKPLPWCDFSQAKLLMGRRIRTSLLQTTKQLTPRWTYLAEFHSLNHKLKTREKRDFDKYHHTKELPELPDVTAVWVTSGGGEPVWGRVLTQAHTPRSYIVETPLGRVHRNCHHLNLVPDSSTEQTKNQEGGQPQASARIITRSQTGAKLRPPERLA